MQWLRSLLFTVLMLVWTLLFAVLYFFAALFLSFDNRFRLARWLPGSVLPMLRVICGLGHRISGAQNLPAGGHVALWKHSSTWETYSMMLVCPRQVWVLKRELEWIPFVGWSIRQMKSIGIDRGSGPSAVRQVIEQGKPHIASGTWVIIFPEGTRMAAGETRKYGVSGALLAREAGCLIVPVAHDAGFYWPRRGLLKKPGTIDVVIGEPIDPAGRDPREINEEVQRWMEATIARLRAGKRD